MARDVLHVRLELDQIHCHDEGDGWGSAEPYLWTVFFKVDGDSVTITDSLTLSGDAILYTTPGSHGNLNDSDVDAGDDVTIPEQIGHWQTYLKPMPVPEPWDALADDIGGTVGVLAVLMEEDNVSDAGAEAGHQALNTAVRDAINQIVATRSFTNQEITDEDIDAVTAEVQAAVEDAIKDQQSFFENLWSWLNKDDTIGDHVWMFKHDDLAEGGTINFSERWKNEGDWEISGHITSTPLCPAEALDDLFSGLSGTRTLSMAGDFSSRKIIDPRSIEKLKKDSRSESEYRKAAGARRRRSAFDLDALRAFRDGPYLERPGLAHWWRLAERNTPSVVRALLTTPTLRKPVWQVMEYLPKLASDLDVILSDKQLANAEAILRGVKEKTRNRHLAIDCSRALEILPMLKGKTLYDALGILASIHPARHPVTDDPARLRISKPSVSLRRKR
jgi:hypothetical protein